MCIKEVVSFCEYFDTLLQEKEPKKTFDTYNEFLIKAIQEYHFERDIKNIEDVKALIIREGRENGSETLKRFFYELNKFKQQKKQHRRNMMKNTRLHQQQSPHIPTIYLPKLSTSYPPLGYWVADTKDIEAQWAQHLATYHLSDKKHKRYPTMVLDTTKLQLDLKIEESVIIRDAESKDIVGVVIRNFGKDQELVEWANDIVNQSTENTKSVRVSFYKIY